MAKGKKHYKSSGSLNFKLMSMEINKDISYVCEQLTEDLVDSAVSSFDDFLDILKFSAENNSFYFALAKCFFNDLLDGKDFDSICDPEKVYNLMFSEFEEEYQEKFSKICNDELISISTAYTYMNKYHLDEFLAIEDACANVNKNKNVRKTLCLYFLVKGYSFLFANSLSDLSSQRAQACFELMFTECVKKCLANPKISYDPQKLFTIVKRSVSLYMSQITKYIKLLADCIVEEMFSVEMEWLTNFLREKEIIDYFNNFIDYSEESDEPSQNLFDCIEHESKSLNSDEDSLSKEIKFIDDYRTLNKLAEDNGFKYDRCNGDHGIFKNDKGLIVVIPQGRTIGKGLSFKIQKIIYQFNKGAYYEK